MADNKPLKEHRFCPYCEEEIAEAAFPYCEACGLQVVKCPGCGQSVARDSKKCPACGIDIKAEANKGS
jgi:predicted amidophosphoribosyltransferase